MKVLRWAEIVAGVVMIGATLLLFAALVIN